MSYDIGVFYTEKRLSDKDALKRYSAFCKEDDLSPYIETSEKIQTFIQELTSIYPQIDDYDEDKLHKCPWSVMFDISEGHILMPITYSSIETVVPLIINLAEKHGLVVVDPQMEMILYAPAGIASELNPRSYYSKAYWPIGIAVSVTFLLALYLSRYEVGIFAVILALILIVLEIMARRAFRKTYVRKIKLTKREEWKPRININIPRWVSYPVTVGIIALGIIYHRGSFKIYGGLFLFILLAIEVKMIFAKKSKKQQNPSP